MTSNGSTFLRGVLLADSIFFAAAGLAGIRFSGLLSTLSGVPPLAFIIAGGVIVYLGWLGIAQQQASQSQNKYTGHHKSQRNQRAGKNHFAGF